MPRRRRAGARLLALLLPFMLATLAAAAGLRAEVERAVRSARLQGATVAVSIRDADSSETLAAINDDRPMIPASNMKLLTTGAALHVLGPDFRFETRILRDGDRIIVVGDGDPAFGDPELLDEMSVGGKPGLGIEEFLDLLVEPIVKADVTEISEIVVDDRIFDREFAHPSWPVEQLNRRYCAQVCGLNFHLNVLHAFPRPSNGVRPLVGTIRPDASWLSIDNKATQRSGKHGRPTAWIARRLGTNDLTLYGNVPAKYGVPVPVTLHDIPAFFAQLLAQRLRDRGVRVEAHRVAEPSDPTSKGTPVGPVVTTSIDTAITRCNRDSQNMYAEALLKRIGHEATKQPGSWSTGAAVVRMAVHERVGDSALTADLIVSDGSGLSRENRIAPRTITAWLNSFHRDERLAGPFIDSLAVGGLNGTLDNRFRGTDVHGAVVQAKSGYIREVSCLSGFVTMPDGRRRTFSIMVNDLPTMTTVRQAKRLQEDIVALIAEDLAASAVTLGGE